MLLTLTLFDLVVRIAIAADCTIFSASFLMLAAQEVLRAIQFILLMCIWRRYDLQSLRTWPRRPRSPVTVVVMCVKIMQRPHNKIFVSVSMVPSGKPTVYADSVVARAVISITEFSADVKQQYSAIRSVAANGAVALRGIKAACIFLWEWPKVALCKRTRA